MEVNDLFAEDESANDKPDTMKSNTRLQSPYSVDNSYGLQNGSDESAQNQLTRLLSSLQTSLMSWLLRNVQKKKVKDEKNSKSNEEQDKSDDDMEAKQKEQNSIQNTLVQALLVRCRLCFYNIY